MSKRGMAIDILFKKCSLAVLLGLLWSCSERDTLIVPVDEPLAEGTPFTVSFGSYADAFKTISLRAGEESEKGVEDLRLLVFDENYRFLYSRKAVLGGEVTPPSSPDDYLPDGKVGGDPVLQFSTTLLTSSKPRYIHFIANHDWTDFQQDYFLEAHDAGELIGGMLTERLELWRCIEFKQGLSEASFKGKVIKLLRNYSRINVVYKQSDGSAPNFNYQGFTVYNAYDKGTVAPFIFNEDLSYVFPQMPDLPTIPPGVEPAEPREFSKAPTYVFDKANRRSEQPLFLIVKGQLEGKRVGYYKLDLKKINEQTGETSLYNLVRNYFYRAVISFVANEGYRTIEEAVRQPAGNNLFASIEMEHYPSVSDGIHTLSVEKIGEVFVHGPAVFQSAVFFNGGIRNVQVFPSWDTNDEYLGGSLLTASDFLEGVLSVPIKKIPTDRTLHYHVNLIAHPDPSSSAGIISRKVNLILRPPYAFELSKLTVSHPNPYRSPGAGEQVQFSFSVPQTMPESIFPLDVYIEAPDLTPDLAKNRLLIEIVGGRYFYHYTVRNKPTAERITLHFMLNSDDPPRDITVTSKYYNDAVVPM